jgi:hypothetical protein
VRGAWPAIARRAKTPELPALGADERREILGAVIALSPERGEPIALELAKKAGMFVSEDREAVRLSAIEALGAYSRAPQVATALREIAQARWGTSDDTRAAAQAAADQIAQRAAGGSA